MAPWISLIPPCTQTSQHACMEMTENINVLSFMYWAEETPNHFCLMKQRNFIDEHENIHIFVQYQIQQEGKKKQEVQHFLKGYGSSLATKT